MIALNTISQQNEMLAGWKAKGKYTFPIVVTADKDFFSKNQYGVRGTPTSFLLNGDGKVVFRHIGYLAGGEKTMEAEAAIHRFELKFHRNRCILRGFLRVNPCSSTVRRLYQRG